MFVVKLIHILLAIVISNDLPAKGCLAQTVRFPGGTPQVLSSTPRGSEFQAEVKKIPSSVPITNALGGHRPNSHLGGGKPPCKGGAGVRGFSWPGEKVFFLFGMLRGQS